MRDLPEQFLVAFSFAGEQRSLVQRIAEATEQRLGKATVFFDDWYEHYIAGDDADLRLQEIYGKRSLLALVCVSASYGGKPWTQAEHAAIRARQMQSRSSPRAADRLAVLPLRVGDGDVPGILFNSIVPDVRQKTIDQVVELIVSRLQLVRGEQPLPAASGAACWPEEPLAFEHSLADRTSQWPAIQQLLTAGSRRRILLFKGASGHGKSVLLSAATAYARLLGVPQAYVDFKNTQHLQQANVLRTLRLDIGGALPCFAQTPDAWTLLEGLRRLTTPLLIVLDTYEKVVETNELVSWIETQLLAEAEQCPHLRFLVGGQKLPLSAHARWQPYAREIELERIADQRAWSDWIRQRNPRVEDKHVEGIVLGGDGLPATISTLLAGLADRLTAPG